VDLEKSNDISRMPSSGILRHVVLVRTDISEERITSIVRVTRIGALGTALVVVAVVAAAVLLLTFPYRRFLSPWCWR
jgi:hypothetical protein